MTFSTLKTTAGREPFIIVEIDLDSCANTFGVLPCTATGASGTECYNTFASCQATPAYAKTTKTYKFTKDHPNLPRGYGFYPALRDVKLMSARITPGEGLGARASATITLKDFSDTDSGTDKYFKTRPYVAIDQGTFFGKLLARTPYYRGRTIRVKTGFLQDPVVDTDFVTHTYVIDTITGPDSSGIVTVTGRDVLRLTTDTQAPATTKATLAAALPAAETSSLTITADDLSPFPAMNGFVKIDSEIIGYLSRSGAVLASLTRGDGGTTAADHAINATVQACVSYTGANVVDVIYDLLTVKAAISTSYITLADWNAEKNLWLSSVNLTTIIAKPIKISQLLAELTEQCMVDLYWDDTSQQVKLKAFAPPQGNVALAAIVDNDIILNSFSREDLQDKRITRLEFYYGMLNYLEDLEDSKNYSNARVQVDSEAEAANAYGDVKPRKIFSRWHPSGNSGVVGQVGGRLMNRFGTTPQRLKFRADIKNTLKLGDFVALSSRRVQDLDGSALNQNVQVIEVYEVDESHILEITALNAAFAGLYGFVGPSTLLNFLAETSTNKLKYAFIAGSGGKMSDGSPGYKIL